MIQPGKSWLCRPQVLAVLLLATLLPMTVAHARDAAFMDPGAMGNGAPEEAIKIEPKGDIDVGETELNVAKRVTLFFNNTTTLPVHIDKIALNNDGNVMADVSNDDCSKQVNLMPQSRCAVEISVTPTSPGPWTVEALVTHNGPGRLARAKLSGKTTGNTDQKKDNGLALNSKDAGMVSFGDVDIDGSKVVRSALMTNDSPDPLTIYSIDVIEAENGLTKLDQGCAVDMELKPGESCPITLSWTPTSRGQISTDLIIRHSGRMGFVVVPIRGTAHGVDSKTASGSDGKTLASSNPTTSTASPMLPTTSRSAPMPPSAPDLERAVKDFPPVSAEALMRDTPAGADAASGSSKKSSKGLRLIGTVGNRAVLLKPDDTTAIASVGDDVSVDDHEARVTAVNGKSVDILEDGKKKTLMLVTAQELVAKAAANMKAAKADGSDGPDSSAGSSMPLVGTSGAPSHGISQSAASSSAPVGIPPATQLNGVTR